MANEVRAGSLNPNSITDALINGDADIKSTKVRHMFQHRTSFGKAVNEAPPATREEWAFTAYGPGTLTGFHGSLGDTGSSTDITFDLKKNGTSVLAAPISFTEADTDGDVKDGVLSAVTLVAGDVMTIVQTNTSATGALSPKAWVNWEEQDQPQ